MHEYYSGFIQILKIQVNYRTSPENKGNENERLSLEKGRVFEIKGLLLVSYLSHAEYLLMHTVAKKVDKLFVIINQF